MKIISVKELIEGEQFIHAVFNFAYSLRGIKIGMLLLPFAWESVYEDLLTGDKVRGTRIPAVALFIGSGFLTGEKQYIKAACWWHPVGTAKMIQAFSNRAKCAGVRIL